LLKHRGSVDGAVLMLSYLL